MDTELELVMHIANIKVQKNIRLIFQRDKKSQFRALDNTTI